MNRKRYIALLILLGLLTGCGAGAGEHIPASAPGSRGGLQSGSSQSELEQSVMESASEQPEEHAAKPEPADSAEDSSAEAPDAAVPEEQGAVLEDFSERPEAIHLYEDENITLVLLPIRNVDNGSPELFLQADSRFSHSVRVDVSNFTLDGIMLEGFFSEEIAANERKQKQVLNFGASLMDTADADSITCRVRIGDDYFSSDSDEEQDVEFPVPTEFYDGCLTYMDALGEEQVLMDNDRGRITLLECGCYPDDHEQNLSGMLYFENQSQIRRRFEVTAVKVNGILLNSFLSDSCSPTPGTGEYSTFQVRWDDIALAGITSIYSLELLIVDGQATTNGYHEAHWGKQSKAGTWYPVTLSRSGSAPEESAKPEEIDGTVIYDEDGVTIYYLQHEERHYRNDAWTIPVCVVNSRSDDISVNFVTSERTSGEASGSSVLANAENTVSDTVYLYTTSGQPLSGTITIYTLSRDKLLIPAQEFTIPGL